MKLLIVTPYYAPAFAYGGPPKFLTEFAQAMKKRGHQVRVVTTDALDHRRNPKLRETIAGVKVSRFKNLSNWLAWQQKFFWPIGAGPFLDRNVSKYDFVFCSDWRHGLNIAAYQTAKKFGLPYGVAAFGELPLTDDWKGVLKRLFDLIYGKKILKDAAVLFAQTDQEIAAYQKFVNHKNIALWPLAIDLAPFAKLPKKGGFRKKYRLKATDKIILFVGRFHRYKGIDKLIQVVAKLKPKLDIKLVLVGRDDGELDNLKKQIKTLKLEDDIILTGPLYNQAVSAVYRDADLYLGLPSHAEETPLAGVMALAAGCPVITNRNAQIPWLDQSRAGITLENDSLLQETLLNLLSHDKILKRMKKSARKLALLAYGWPQRTNQFETIIHKIKKTS